MLALLDRLIAIGVERGVDTLAGEVIEHAPQPVEHRGSDQELLVAELG
jgi:hypothetical protein